jgi:hypothetical protein
MPTASTNENFGLVCSGQKHRTAMVNSKKKVSERQQIDGWTLRLGICVQPRIFYTRTGGYATFLDCWRESR